MKKIYSILIAMVALFLFAPLAVAADGHPPWNKVINSPGRFKLVMGDAAVFDKETGLVWEQSPDGDARSWLNALEHCYQKTVGGRKGWRLPTIEELASLVDPANPDGNPDLPPDHPFDNVLSATYWSATTDASDPAVAWDVLFGDGVVFPVG